MVFIKKKNSANFHHCDIPIQYLADIMFMINFKVKYDSVMFMRIAS